MGLRKWVVVTSTVAALVAVPLTGGIAPAAGNQSLGAEVKRVPSPPTVTELRDYIPFYAQLPDGRLVGISERTVEGVQEADARYSTDDGHSWSEPETLFKLPTKQGKWDLSNILLDRDNELHFIYTLYNKLGQGHGLSDIHYDVWHVRSTDGRRNWTAPNPVWQGGYAGSMNSVIQLRNGRIVLPLCILTTRSWGNPGAGFDAFTDMGRFSSKVTYSDDDGDTWHLCPVEFKTSMPYIGADGMIEPVVIQLKDDRVWMLIRTQNGRFYESFSKDGDAWLPAQPTRILSSDSPAALVRLQDGRIVMLWNNCLRYPYAQGGRFVIHAAISEDETQTWRGFREVTRHSRVNEPHPPTGDFGVSYVWPVVTKDQKIIFNTSAWPTTGSPAMVHLDPEWLYGTSHKTDFSAGIDDWSCFGTKGVGLAPNPEKPGAQALEIRKPRADWPAAAVWNLPMGVRGRLLLKLMLNPGFAGARIGLTDHFSVPFDPEDQIYNLYTLVIGPHGELAGGKKLQTGQWHSLAFDWDCDRGECRVTADGRPISTLHLTRDPFGGVSYLRLVSMAEDTDMAGLLVESVDADVSSSWRK
jgi:hypothetical protein